MINGAKHTKLEISIESFPFFSSYFEKAGVCPVMRVNVSGFAKDVCDRLEISVVGKCGETEFIHRHDFVRESFCPDSYNYKKKDSCAFDYAFSSFSYNSLFLSSIEKEQDADIYVMVSFGSEVACEKTIIKLLPRNYWQGIEYEPLALSAFVIPYEEHIAEICKDIPENLYADYVKCDKRTLSEGIHAIYKALISRSIIYSRPAGYGAAMPQRIRLPEELFTGSSLLATPLEIALLFSSCAKHCGFDTSIIFGKGKSGEGQILCGIWRKRGVVTTPVCENYEKLCEAILYGELVIVEPSVFATAQNTSFSLACENAKSVFLNDSFTLLCSINVNECTSYGVNPILSNAYDTVNEKVSLKSLYSSLKSSSCMKMLSGEQTGRYPEIPLLCDFDDVFYKGDIYRKLLPMEYNINLGDFAGLDKGFSSVLTSAREEKKYSVSEKDLAVARLEKFKEKVIFSDACVSVLRDEPLYETASSMVFSKDNAKSYTIFGYIKVSDKLTDLKYFAPVCLVPTKLKYENGSFYFKQNGTPIVNKVFIRNALKNASISYESFLGSAMPSDKGEIFELFENVRCALSQTDDRYSYEIIREAHIIHVDISDYLLWSDLSILSNKVVESNSVASLLHGADKNENNKEPDVYTLSSKGVFDAVNYNGDVVVTGAFSQDKKSFLCSLVKKEITEGKKILVACKNDEITKFVKDTLSEENVSEQVILLNEGITSTDISLEVSALLEKYKNIPQSNIANVSTDLSQTFKTLLNYEEKLNRAHKLGMSVRSALKAYLDANLGMKDIPELKVDEVLFKDADEAMLDSVFNEAGRLLNSATKLCKLSGLESHTPICNHPLYGTRPENLNSKQALDRFSELCENVRAILSQYRDVFLDVSMILGIDICEIQNISKLKKLNELYELCISSRDIDVPYDFIESDIESFANNINRISNISRRCDEIRQELSFFQHEIFEDVETLLSGEQYEKGEKGILKKFIHKKNNQDTLLQYINAEGRIGFSSMPVEKIYTLLYEYKAYIKELRSNKCDYENSDVYSSLASIATTASTLVDQIAGENSFDRKQRLSNVFRLITLIPVDSNLARNITVSRAKMSELFSDENNILHEMENLLGTDFLLLSFDSGILSFDGFSNYLRSVEDMLFMSDKWLKWLYQIDKTRQILPEFVEYIEKHGVIKNSDRLFAKSLLKPVYNRIVLDTFDKNELESMGIAKEKYIENLTRANELNNFNFTTSYEQSVCHCAETTHIDELLNSKNIKVCDFIEKNKQLLSKVKPCFIVKHEDMTKFFNKNTLFDTVVIIDDMNSNLCAIPSMTFGKRCVILDMTPDNSGKLSSLAVNNKMKHIDTGKIFSNADSTMLTWLNSCVYNESLSLANLADVQNVELVRINGMYDRTERFVNKTEAELSLSKALEALINNPDNTVVITAFTKQQCSFIERLSLASQRKNKVLDTAIKENRFKVITVNQLYLAKCDYLVVSACFGQDKNGRYCVDFADAQNKNNFCVGAVYTYLCENKAKNVCIITSLNVNESRHLRRSSKNMWYFNSLCEFLTDGRIPVCTHDNDKSAENCVATGIIGSGSAEKSRTALCCGKHSYGCSLRSHDNGLYVFLDCEKDMSIHDELYIKNMISKNSKTMSVSPASFIGESGRELVLDFFKSSKEV